MARRSSGHPRSGSEEQGQPKESRAGPPSSGRQSPPINLLQRGFQAGNEPMGAITQAWSPAEEQGNRQPQPSQQLVTLGHALTKGNN